MPTWTSGQNGKGDENRTNLKKYSAGYDEINWSGPTTCSDVGAEVSGPSMLTYVACPCGETVKSELLDNGELKCLCGRMYESNA